VNIQIHHSGFRDQALLWTLILSLCLHLTAFIWIPKPKFNAASPLLTLKVELAPPATPEPPPEPPIAPEPKVEPKPQPVVKPIIKPVPKHELAPITEPPPSPQAEPAEPTPPAVITATPKMQTPPVFTAPPPEPLKPTGPSPQDLDAARTLYGSQLAREIARHKQYPRIAQMRGWQGEVEIDLQLDGNGSVLSSKIHTSSGFDALDKQALEMVKKASPFPAPPEVLRGNAFNILVPVSFRLE
jgi:periplasmic protein TonB